MSCRACRERLAEHWDEALPDVGAHLAECAACRAEWGRLCAALELLAAPLEADLGDLRPGLWAAVAAAEARPARREMWLGLLATASWAMAAGLLLRLWLGALGWQPAWPVAGLGPLTSLEFWQALPAAALGVWQDWVARAVDWSLLAEAQTGFSFGHAPAWWLVLTAIAAAIGEWQMRRTARGEPVMAGGY
ncbi:MAG: hypothetical protein IT204_04920 [Fimbriimonadaceae bacterium]|nr:hypothetical protein [Fimbriimonadaceae bacterium]